MTDIICLTIHLPSLPPLLLRPLPPFFAPLHPSLPPSFLISPSSLTPSTPDPSRASCRGRRLHLWVRPLAGVPYLGSLVLRGSRGEHGGGRRAPTPPLPPLQRPLHHRRLRHHQA